VDVHEVVAYLLKRAQVATQRIYDMTHTTRLALSSSPTLRYVPPKVGFIRIRTTEGFSCAEDAGLFKPISNSQVTFNVVIGWFVLLCAVRFGCASVLFSGIRGSDS
jgi:hypothetical protein